MRSISCQVALLSAGLALAACGGSEPSDVLDSGAAADSGTSPDAGQAADSGSVNEECTPIERVFVTNAKPIVEARCAKCHGVTPQFGAPMSLVSYADFVAERNGVMVAATVVERLVAGSMPPRGEPGLDHVQLETLASWASCGLVHPDPVGNLMATAPVHVAPDEPPSGTTRLDLTADQFPVGPTVRDQYQSFVFRNVVTSDAFVRRIEARVDDSRVLHHVTLTYANGDYLYAWAPGGSAAQFPEGGLRIRPTDVFEVEIHYNNGAGVPGVRDSSGVTIYYAEPTGTEYVQLSPQTWSILVPAHGTSSATADCVVTSDFTMFAGMPHMHEVGSTFSTVLRRVSGEEIEVNRLSGWSFDAQRYYDYRGIQARVGDHLIVTCGYDNPTGTPVRAGLRTSDEMCFDFIYATPATAALDCPGF